MWKVSVRLKLKSSKICKGYLADKKNWNMNANS